LAEGLSSALPRAPQLAVSCRLERNPLGYGVGIDQHAKSLLYRRLALDLKLHLVWKLGGCIN
jgi:hypothetical protein